jgi:transmembrane sensor
MSELDPTISRDAIRVMLEREAQEWLILLTSGCATAGDAAALKRWCGQSKFHAEAFAEANLIWESLGIPAQRMPNPDSLIHANSNRAVTIGRRTFLGGAAAAAAAAIGYLVVRPPLELWPSAYELTADYRTRTGERRRIGTENGVSIDLNTRTSLNVRQGDVGERFELISGEAAIEIARKLPTPLTVAAAGGRIHVVDAQFNLRCDGQRAVVTCHRGSVGIEYFGQSITLRESRQISYANGAMDPVATVDPAVVMAWCQGQLVFRQTPLSQVIEEINRYRSGRIILINEVLGRRLVEARIPLDHVDDVIALVREAYGAQVTTLPGGVLVLS